MYFYFQPPNVTLCSWLLSRWICSPTEETDEDEEDENSEESVEEESDEDLTDKPKTFSTQPPYSLIPPPPVWVQRNQGLSMTAWFLTLSYRVACY